MIIFLAYELLDTMDRHARIIKRGIISCTLDQKIAIDFFGTLCPIFLGYSNHHGNSDTVLVG